MTVLAGTRTPLSPKLQQTLELICHGYTTNEIAERLHWSPETIKSRVKWLLEWFHARNRAHLAALAVATGVVTMEDPLWKSQEC